MDLEERVGADLLDCECGCGGEETGVLDFFDCFADGEDEGAVYKGEDDVGVVRVCDFMVMLMWFCWCEK